MAGSGWAFHVLAVCSRSVGAGCKKTPASDAHPAACIISALAGSFRSG